MDIADQAASIFRKRDLDPRLQFVQMFEMEFNEIVSISKNWFSQFQVFWTGYLPFQAFEQANAFTAFYSDVQAAHNANNVST